MVLAGGGKSDWSKPRSQRVPGAKAAVIGQKRGRIDGRGAKEEGPLRDEACVELGAGAGEELGWEPREPGPAGTREERLLGRAGVPKSV
mmetsp:Transcript_714/g.883  ORF Transcript_714/g.883 Transcript_714/m.883 type:complete len:89 (+) Transcript_714:342-608(+)